MGRGQQGPGNDIDTLRQVIVARIGQHRRIHGGGVQQVPGVIHKHFLDVAGSLDDHIAQGPGIDVIDIDPTGARQESHLVKGCVAGELDIAHRQGAAGGHLEQTAAQGGADFQVTVIDEGQAIGGSGANHRRNQVGAGDLGVQVDGGSRIHREGLGHQEIRLIEDGTRRARGHADGATGAGAGGSQGCARRRNGHGTQFQAAAQGRFIAGGIGGRHRDGLAGPHAEGQVIRLGQGIGPAVAHHRGGATRPRNADFHRGTGFHATGKHHAGSLLGHIDEVVAGHSGEIQARTRGIQAQGNRGGCRTQLAGGTDCLGLEDMIAFQQTQGGRVAPVAVFVGRGFTQQGAAVEYLHLGGHLGRPHQGRGGRTGDARRGGNGRGGNGRVDGQGKGSAGRTGVAQRIHADSAEDMITLAQIGGKSVTPAAGGIGRQRGHKREAVIESDIACRIRCALERGPQHAGASVAGTARIVCQGQNDRDRRNTGVHREAEGGGGGAEVAGAVHRHRRDGVACVAQALGPVARRQAPGTRAIRRRCGQQAAAVVVVEANLGAGRGTTGNHRPAGAHRGSARQTRGGCRYQGIHGNIAGDGRDAAIHRRGGDREGHRARSHAHHIRIRNEQGPALVRPLGIQAGGHAVHSAIRAGVGQDDAGRIETGHAPGHDAPGPNGRGNGIAGFERSESQGGAIGPCFHRIGGDAQTTGSIPGLDEEHIAVGGRDIGLTQIEGPGASAIDASAADCRRRALAIDLNESIGIALACERMARVQAIAAHLSNGRRRHGRRGERCGRVPIYRPGKHGSSAAGGVHDRDVPGQARDKTFQGGNVAGTEGIGPGLILGRQGGRSRRAAAAAEVQGYLGSHGTGVAGIRDDRHRRCRGITGAGIGDGNAGNGSPGILHRGCCLHAARGRRTDAQGGRERVDAAIGDVNSDQAAVGGGIGEAHCRRAGIAGTGRVHHDGCDITAGIQQGMAGGGHAPVHLGRGESHHGSHSIGTAATIYTAHAEHTLAHVNLDQGSPQLYPHAGARSGASQGNTADDILIVHRVIAGDRLQAEASPHRGNHEGIGRGAHIAGQIAGRDGETVGTGRQGGHRREAPGPATVRRGGTNTGGSVEDRNQGLALGNAGDDGQGLVVSATGDLLADSHTHGGLGTHGGGAGSLHTAGGRRDANRRGGGIAGAPIGDGEGGDDPRHHRGGGGGLYAPGLIRCCHGDNGWRQNHIAAAARANGQAGDMPGWGLVVQGQGHGVGGADIAIAIGGGEADGIDAIHRLGRQDVRPVAAKLVHRGGRHDRASGAAAYRRPGVTDGHRGARIHAALQGDGTIRGDQIRGHAVVIHPIHPRRRRLAGIERNAMALACHVAGCIGSTGNEGNGTLAHGQIIRPHQGIAPGAAGDRGIPGRGEARQGKADRRSRGAAGNTDAGSLFRRAHHIVRGHCGHRQGRRRKVQGHCAIDTGGVAACIGGGHRQGAGGGAQGRDVPIREGVGPGAAFDPGGVAATVDGDGDAGARIHGAGEDDTGEGLQAIDDVVAGDCIQAQGRDGAGDGHGHGAGAAADIADGVRCGGAEDVIASGKGRAGIAPGTIAVG